jgi:hypothetical protein
MKNVLKIFFAPTLVMLQPKVDVLLAESPT